MLVISMLDQRVVGVVGLDAAGSRIRMPSAKAPGACLGHEPGDTKGQQRSQADSRDPAKTSTNALEQQRSRRHAVHGIHEVSCPASPDHALSGAAAVVKMPIYAQNSSNSCWS